MASASMWQRPVEESLEIGIREMALPIPRSPQKGTYMRSFWRNTMRSTNCWLFLWLCDCVSVWLCEGQQFFNQQMQLNGCHWLIGFWMFLASARLRARRETGGGLGTLIKFGVDALKPLTLRHELDGKWWKPTGTLQITAGELGTQPPSSPSCL